MRDRFPWALALLYAALFTWLGAVRFATHHALVDFGIFAQTAASAFGCFCNPIEGSHWAFHFSPILYLAGALLKLWPSPYALIALQAAACALVIPPVYALVAGRAGKLVARTTALIVFFYPALGGLTFVDFHENGFAPAAVAWGLWAFDSGYLIATAAFALLAICVKEDQALFVGIAAAIGAWRFRKTRPGWLALGVAIVAFAAVLKFFLFIQPQHVALAHWAPQRFYDWTAADLRALPLGILQRIGFVLLVFLPLLFIPFRSRAMWLAAAPLAEVLLSRMPTTFTLGTHYAGAWLGWVLAAFAFALRRMDPASVRRWIFASLALCAVEYGVANPLHPKLNLRGIEPRDRALDAALSWIAPGDAVATQEEAYTHLALDHPQATLLPESPSAALTTCYALIDRDFPGSPRLQEYGAALQRLVDRGTYRLVRGEGGVELYRSSSACSASATSAGQSPPALTAR